MNPFFIALSASPVPLFQGRAIRHQGDYATILLLDRRYSRASTIAKLPGWISKHLRKMDKFGPVFAAVTKVLTCTVNSILPHRYHCVVSLSKTH